MGDCLPIHPQPLKNESLTSWVVRLANANAIPVRSFLSNYFGNEEWRRRDLDLLDLSRLSELAILGRPVGGEIALQRMTLTNWLQVVGPRNPADRKSWMSSLWVGRYCPVCLSEDRVPYLKRIWRLRFLPVCAEHRVLLNRQCWRCGRTQPLLYFISGDGPLLCKSCDSVLSKSPVVRPNQCERLYRLTARITEVLEGSSPPMPESDYTSAEFFAILRLLMRFFDHYTFPQGKSWEGLCRTHGLPSTNPGEWRDNEVTACVLLEESLTMMEAWPTSVRKFLLAHIGMFDRDIRYFVWNPEARSLLSPYFALPQQVVAGGLRRKLSRSLN